MQVPDLRALQRTAYNSSFFIFNTLSSVEDHTPISTVSFSDPVSLFFPWPPKALPISSLSILLFIWSPSTNYLIWHGQILPLIESQDLIGHIDGSIFLPSKFNPATFQTPNDKYLEWRAADQRLLCLLLFSHWRIFCWNCWPLYHTRGLACLRDRFQSSVQGPWDSSQRWTPVNEKRFQTRDSLCSCLQKPLRSVSCHWSSSWSHEQSALVPLWPRCDFSSFSSN